MSRRCGYCGGSGHNRRTCPTAEKATPEGVQNPNKRKGKCGYCHRYHYKVDRTHNARKCPERKNDLNNFIEQNKVWAKQFKEKMVENGFGIGTIISRHERVFIITHVDWEELSYNGGSGYHARPLEDIDKEGYYYTRTIYPPNFMQDDYYNCEILSRVSADIIRKQFPPDWEMGMYGIPHKLRDSATGGRQKKK